MCSFESGEKGRALGADRVDDGMCVYSNVDTAACARSLTFYSTSYPDEEDGGGDESLSSRHACARLLPRRRCRRPSALLSASLLL